MPIVAPVVTGNDGRQRIVWDFRAEFVYPFDPEQPFFLLASPPGGVGKANYPFLAQGNPGQHAVIDPVIDKTWIEYEDPTPESFEFVELQPATDTQPQRVKLRAVIRRGKPGKDGNTIITPGHYPGAGGVTPGYVLAANAAGAAFELVPQRVGGRHWAAAVSEAGAGTTTSKTLTTISIPANTYAFPYQIEVAGTSIVTASGADCRVDLVARLNSETGPILGRGYGLGGINDRLTLIDGPDTNASLASVTVAANAAAMVYLRVEKQAGADSFSTGASPTRFRARVHPA